MSANKPFTFSHEGKIYQIEELIIDNALIQLDKLPSEAYKMVVSSKTVESENNKLSRDVEVMVKMQCLSMAFNICGKLATEEEILKMTKNLKNQVLDK